MILYFTGAGNSAYIANKLSEELQDELLCINDRMKKSDYSLVETQKPLVFVVPTYAWRIPRVVERWIERTKFSENTPAYFVMTCGNDIGYAEKYLSALCQNKRLIFQGVKGIVMPDNYIVMYQTLQPSEAKQVIEHAAPQIKECAEVISHKGHLNKTKASVLDRMKSSVVNDLFYPLMVKADKFMVKEQCIRCGKCEKECPLGNIELKEGKPVWGKSCTHCMACICKCPVEAIEYGKNSVGKTRYQCPL